jgi:hypothetical protein
MADEQKPKAPKKEKPAKTKEAAAPAEEGILTAAAKAIGTAAGKIATATGVADAPPKPNTPKKVRIPKLQKKNNPHLPRKVKKAQKKAELAKSKA